MECFRDLFKLAFILVLLADLEDFASGLIVESKQPAVGSEGVKDVLESVDEEVDPGHHVALHFQSLQVCVGKQQELITRCVRLALKTVHILVVREELL